MRLWIYKKICRLFVRGIKNDRFRIMIERWEWPVNLFEWIVIQIDRLESKKAEDC